MILGFKTKVNGKLTHFVQKILASVLLEWAEAYVPKKHTIRHGKRWRAGMKLHLATGVRTKEYFQFNENIKGLEICKSVQDIKIKDVSDESLDENTYLYEDYVPKLKETFYLSFKVYVDGRLLSLKEIDLLAKNDGFDSTHDFFQWFNTDFEGQIIHWTDLRY